MAAKQRKIKRQGDRSVCLPVLMSRKMATAAHRGRKSQTRRICKPGLYPDGQPLPVMQLAKDGGPIFWTGQPDPAMLKDPYCDLGAESPYGRAGDLLWVREKWRLAGDLGGAKLSNYKTPHIALGSAVRYAADEPEEQFQGTYRPSIHMPRWASRTTLRVLSVGVERLQDISEADCQAEGVQRLELSPNKIDFGGGPVPVHPLTSSYREAFEALWEEINGPGSWSRNPWVWVIKFERFSNGIGGR